MKYVAYQFYIIIILMLPFSAYSDTLILKDGSTIRGKIITIGIKEIVISTIIGEISIEGEKISKVDWSEKEALPKDANSLLTPAPDQHIAAEYPELSYAEMHLKKQVGAGGGLLFGIRDAAAGGSAFYEINLSENTQLHVQLSITVREPNVSIYNVTEAGEEIGNGIYIASSIKTTKLSSSYRVFQKTNSGFFIGAGGGAFISNFKLKAISTYDTTLSKYTSSPYPYSSQLRGLFVMGEIGWQGKDGYYFHIGYQPVLIVAANDNYDVNSIANAASYQNEINNVHEKQKSLSQISIGFSLFF